MPTTFTSFPARLLMLPGAATPAVPESPLTLRPAPSLEPRAGREGIVRVRAPSREQIPFGDRILDLAGEMLDTTDTGAVGLQTERTIPETTTYDFQAYAFIRPMLARESTPPFLVAAFTTVAFRLSVRKVVRERWLGGFPTDPADIEHANIVVDQIVALFTDWVEPDLHLLFHHLLRFIPADEQNTTQPLVDALETAVAAVVMGVGLDDQQNRQLGITRQRTWKGVYARLLGALREQHPALLVECANRFTASGNRVPAAGPSIDFGLALTYRQNWQPLGVQRGEVVKTIPLGPRQTEKISVRIVDRRKSTSSFESRRASESNNERSQTTKDAVDVVREAKEEFRWMVDAKASGGFEPFFSASVSTEFEQTASDQIKSTKNHLNDSMQRASTKIAQETRVVVTTESEQTTETSQTSELVNPNDEIALTYVYSRLQRQYEISTSLAFASSVVFVTEPVPTPEQVDAEWLRKHAWVLLAGGLDPAFQRDLELVVTTIAEPAEAEDAVDAAAQKVASVLDSLASSPGPVTPPDTLGSVLETFSRNAELRRTRQRQRTDLAAAEARVLAHVRDNLIHFMREIWRREDPDQRLRRYSHVFVPTKWRFVAADDDAEPSPLPVQRGEYVPVVDIDTFVPLSEIVDIAGPIGFSGNVVALSIRPDAPLGDLRMVLAAMRSQYQRVAVRVAAATGPQLVDAVARWATPSIELHWQYRAADEAWHVRVVDSPDVTVVAASHDGRQAEGLGVWIRLRERPEDGAELRLSLVPTPELEEPELRFIRMQQPLPFPDEEPLVFTDELLAAMRGFRKVIADTVPTDATWDSLSERARVVIRTAYHDYLLWREHVAPVLLDTNNLTLDLVTGVHPGIEPFKRVHRAVDVVRAFEDSEHVRLENARLAARLSQGTLEDPDIERMTIETRPADGG